MLTGERTWKRVAVRRVSEVFLEIIFVLTRKTLSGLTKTKVCSFGNSHLSKK